MAPNIKRNYPTTDIMSAQHHFKSSASRSRSSATSSSSGSISNILRAHGMKDIKIGKDQRSVLLPTLPPLDAAIHSRQQAFYRFSDEILCLENEHTPSELISALQQELPITSLSLCYSDAQTYRASVFDFPYKVQYLQYHKFWNKVGNVEFRDFTDSDKRSMQFKLNALFLLLMSFHLVLVSQI